MTKIYIFIALLPLVSNQVEAPYNGRTLPPTHNRIKFINELKLKFLIRRPINNNESLIKAIYNVPKMRYNTKFTLIPAD
jgi:hypothetical protein